MNPFVWVADIIENLCARLGYGYVLGVLWISTGALRANEHCVLRQNAKRVTLLHTMCYFTAVNSVKE